MHISVDVDELLLTFSAAHATETNYGGIYPKATGQVIDGKDCVCYMIEHGENLLWTIDKAEEVERRTKSYQEMTGLKPSEAALIVSKDGFDFMPKADLQI
ncbi:hypothetical protein [Nodosilinea nodulosa]|uniref:hypothetical protein n=1 Tax=Nodosilinea nodulosa TaxID=416001 RepID=UPI0012D79EE6|nr:hypothetical protein [Nodosilinea nodulosa]